MVALLAAMPALAACAAGGGGGGAGGGGPVPVVAEFGLEQGAPEEREFVLNRPPAPIAASPSAGTAWSFEPSVAWVNDGRYLGVITWGSSSCPSGAHAVEVVAEQVVEIRLRPPSVEGDACTADISGYVTVVELPEGITPAKPLVARFEDHEVTVKAVRRWPVPSWSSGWSAA